MNNLDQEAMIYQNNANKNNNNYLKIKLLSNDKNLTGIGTKVTIKHQNQVQFQELKMTRGYQSSSEPLIHFGLGKTEKIDEVSIEWKSGKTSVIKDVSVNQTLEIKEKESTSNTSPAPNYNKYLQTILLLF